MMSLVSSNHSYPNFRKMACLHFFKCHFAGGIYKVIKRHCSSYLTMGAKLSSFLLKNNPWTRSSDGARSDVQILCNLAGTILSDIKETELGKEAHVLCGNAVELL